jgi:hypothetical protein
MTDSAEIENWKKDFEVVLCEATNLVVNHHLYVEVRGIIADSPTARKPSTFHSWLGDLYVGASVMRVRRLLDTGKHRISLCELLHSISARSILISRERHVGLWKEVYGTRDDWETVYLPVALKDFARLCGARATFLPKRQVQSDIRSLESVAKAIESFANKRVAHYDAQWQSTPPTYGDLETAITQIENLVKRYSLFLRGHAPEKLLPVWQYDWKCIFRAAWVPPSPN